MSNIRPPGSSPTIAPGSLDNASKKAEANQETAAGKQSNDAFAARSSTAMGNANKAQLQQLQALVANNTGPNTKLNNQDLALIAAAFASMLQQHGQLDRLQRAKLFANQVVKHKRLSALFQGASEEHLERMCDAIAAVIDGSPVFAQLVDDVTEGARSLGER